MYQLWQFIRPTISLLMKTPDLHALSDSHYRRLFRLPPRFRYVVYISEMKTQVVFIAEFFVANLTVELCSFVRTITSWSSLQSSISFSLTSPGFTSAKCGIGVWISLCLRDAPMCASAGRDWWAIFIFYKTVSGICLSNVVITMRLNVVAIWKNLGNIVRNITYI